MTTSLSLGVFCLCKLFTEKIEALNFLNHLENVWFLFV